MRKHKSKVLKVHKSPAEGKVSMGSHYYNKDSSTSNSGQLYDEKLGTAASDNMYVKALNCVKGK